MTKGLLAITIVLFMNSCNSGTTTQTEQQITNVETTGIEVKISNNLSYKIIKEVPNDTLGKDNIDIELSRKATKEELTDIANNLHSSRTKYIKVWIFYYLTGMTPGSGAWATTHFTPNLDIQILGSTSEQENISNLEANNVEGNIIGKWHEEQATSSSYVIYQKGKKYFLKTIFKNGQTMTEELKERKLNQYSVRYDYVENLHGEYLEVNQNDELEFYNKENKKFAVGQKTN